MEIFQIPQLRQPIMIVAFSGWSDAGEAATGALTHLMENLSHGSLSSEAVLVAEYEPEDFYDFQVNRPMISVDDSLVRSVNWPSTQIYGLSTPEFENDFVLVLGVEPSMKWKTFTTLLLDLADDLEVELVVTLGAMLADAPHTRPISITITSQNEIARSALNIERSHYEGPVGIMSVLGMEFEKAGIPTIAVWASVPHYVQNAPSPKATLSMLIEIERLLKVEFEHGSLADEAFTWERSIDELAEGDEDMAGYIEQLESTRDALDSEAAQGEALAQEFERFLKLEDDAKPETDDQ